MKSQFDESKPTLGRAVNKRNDVFNAPKITGASFAGLLLLVLGACDQTSTAPQAATPGPTVTPQETASASQTSAAQTPADRSYTYGTVVSFAQGGQAKRYQVAGWSTAEKEFTWTDKTTAVLAFKIPPTQTPLKLRMSLEGLTGAGLPFQPVKLLANEKEIASWEVSAKQDFTALIPAEHVRASDTLTLTLQVPKAATPASLGMNNDVRTLGVHCFELEITQN